MDVQRKNATIDKKRQAKMRSLDKPALRSRPSTASQQPAQLFQDSSAQGMRLQATMAQLQKQLEQSRSMPWVPMQSSKGYEKTSCCVFEMQWDRQQDLQDAIMVVRPAEVGRISQLLAQGPRMTRCAHGCRDDGAKSKSVAINSEFHGAMISGNGVFLVRTGVSREGNSEPRFS